MLTEVTFFSSTAGDGEDKVGGVQQFLDDELASGLGKAAMIVGCEVVVGIWGTVKIGAEFSPWRTAEYNLRVGAIVSAFVDSGTTAVDRAPVELSMMLRFKSRKLAARSYKIAKA